ncbi:MAG TPA: LuxR C-terminal-related transcriptional regulator, partial [Anaerolineales bacterium]
KIVPEEKERLRRYIDALRAAATCTRGDISGGIRNARSVLENLMPEDYFFLGLIEHYVAYAYQASGKLAQGAAAQERACQNALRHCFHKEYVVSKSEMARFNRLQGHLHAAAEAYQNASDYASRHHLDLDLQIIPLAGLADIYREWNDIPEANRLLAEPSRYFSSSLAPLDWFYMIDTCLAIAKNRILHSEFDQAETLIHTARLLAQTFHTIPDLFDEVRAVNVRLLLARGDLAAAVSWADRKECEAREKYIEISPTQRIAIVRVYLAADQADKAGCLLVNLLADLEGSEQGERLFEALILQAQALWQEGFRTQSMEILDRLIAMAEPENRIRSFIDSGEPMKILLSYRLGMYEQEPAAAKKSPGYAYVLRLIENFRARPQKTALDKRPAPAEPVILTQLAEPLSERELEVLNLLAKGYSSGEVARSLVISVNTAKAHIKSIYQKLDVHSRKEAIETAFSLSLYMAEA